MLEEGPEGNHQQAAEVLQQQQGGAAAGAPKSAQMQALQPAQAEAEGVAEPQVRQQNVQLRLGGVNPTDPVMEGSVSTAGLPHNKLTSDLPPHLVKSAACLQQRACCAAMPGHKFCSTSVSDSLHLVMWQLQDGQLATVWDAGDQCSICFMAAAAHLCLQLVRDCPALQAARPAGEEAPRETAADSFVAALLQRASISGGEAEGMLLGEGGLDSGAAQQLRRDMEERVARASEGVLEPQQQEGYGQEVGLRLLLCRPHAAGDGTAMAGAVGRTSASVLAP